MRYPGISGGTDMTRRGYLATNAIILVTLIAAFKVIEKPLWNPAIMWIGPEPKDWYLLPGSLMILWLVGAPAWSWSTIRRLQMQERPLWWGAIPAAIGLGAIAVAFAGEFFFPDPGLFGAGNAAGGGVWPGVAQSDPEAGSQLEPRTKNFMLLEISGYLIVVAAATALLLFTVALFPSARRANDEVVR